MLRRSGEIRLWSWRWNSTVIVKIVISHHTHRSSNRLIVYLLSFLSTPYLLSSWLLTTKSSLHSTLTRRLWRNSIWKAWEWLMVCASWHTKILINYLAPSCVATPQQARIFLLFLWNEEDLSINVCLQRQHAPLHFPKLCDTPSEGPQRAWRVWRAC